MDDFEKAIRVIFSQDASITALVREQATGYCDAIRHRPDGWRFCWEQFLQKDSLEVKFWCLQSISQGIPGLPAEARAELRVVVLVWMRDVAPLGQQEVFVRNKIALVYAVLLKWDYPSNWPSGWRDVMSLLDKGPNVVDIFLRILGIFDQEVVSDEIPRSPEDRQRSQVIKHAMREADVLRLAECWYSVLATFTQTCPQLVVDCLKVIGIYIVWVDIHTVANDKFLTAICSLIKEAGSHAADACDCLSAVLAKKMPASKKVQMFSQLHILQRLDGCAHRSSADLALLEKEGALFNCVGEVALEAYVDLRVQKDAESATLAQTAWSFIENLMPFVLGLFSHQEYHIAVAVEPFLTLFFAKVKSFVAVATEAIGPDDNRPCHLVSLEQMKPILVGTLKLIIQRVAYPDWFQHDDAQFEDDERHIAFVEFRRRLTHVYRRIFLVDEQMGFQFVQASLTQLVQNLSAVRPMEVEAVLHIYKETGEIVKDVPQHLQNTGPLATSFVQLCECEALFSVEHWGVQLALIDVCVRYGRIFGIHPELFGRFGSRVLETFIGRQGIRSSNPRVASRACTMFSRFLKLAKKQIAPFSSQIYEQLKDLMLVQYVPSSLMTPALDGSVPKVALRGGLKSEDQVSLYEAVANLVASLPAEQLRPGLQMLLQGAVGNLSEILSAPQPKIAADMHGHACWAARSIEVIASVSKPFSAANEAHACVSADWEGVLSIAARILEGIPGKIAHDAGLWRAGLFLCRRMVEVLGDKFLAHLETLLPLLYSGHDHTSLTEVSVFAHHVVCHYQSRCQVLLQNLLHVLFLRPHDMWKQMPDGSEQLKREKLELGCAVLQLLKESAQRCPSALLEPMLLQSGVDRRVGPDLVAFLLHGLADPRELRPFFLSASTWSVLLDVAVASPATQVALASLPLSQILQQLLWSCVRMDFNDAQAQKILAEVACIIRHLTSSRQLPEVQQRQAMEALQQALLGALPGLRSELAPRRLCEALSQDASLKDVQAALHQCAVEWRRDCGS